MSVVEQIETAQSDHVVRGAVYRFHDSAREHATEQSAQEEPADGQVLRMALDFLLDTMTRAEGLLTPTHRLLSREFRYRPGEPVEFDGNGDALAWLESQRDNLRAAVRAADDAGLGSSAAQLTHALWPLLHAHHDYDLWDETHAIALRAVRNGLDQGITDPAFEVEILATWAVGMRGAGRHDDAIEAFDEVLSLARTANDGWAEAQALHELGATHLAAGHPQDAEPLLLHGRDRRTTLAHLAVAAGDTRNQITFLRAVAITDVCLGQVQILLGRPGQAVGTLASARATLLSLPVPDLFNAARALAWQGHAHTLNCDLAEGRVTGRQAVAECDRAGSPRWRARSRELFGQTLQASDRQDEARDRYREAIAIYTPISPTDMDRVQQRLRALAA